MVGTFFTQKVCLEIMDYLSRHSLNFENFRFPSWEKPFKFGLKFSECLGKIINGKQPKSLFSYHVKWSFPQHSVPLSYFSFVLSSQTLQV